MNEFKSSRQIVGVVAHGQAEMSRIWSVMRDLGFYSLIWEKHPDEPEWFLVSGFAPHLMSREVAIFMISELVGGEVECLD